MGNSLNFYDFHDVTGPGTSVKFFQALRLKEIKYFFNRMQENMLSDFDINRAEEVLRWREFFSHFSEIREKIEVDKERQKRANWHPSCAGFEMKRTEKDPYLLEDGDEVDVPDDFTDDDLSDDEEREYDENGEPIDPRTKFGKKKKEIPRMLDSQFNNPIFFGYTMLKTAEVEKRKALEKEEMQQAEKKAVENAKASRTANLDTFEAAMTSQREMRLKKINDLEERYEAARKKREEDYDSNEKYLTPAAFKLYKVQWQQDADAAQAAFEEEVGGMQQIHSEKSSNDIASLKKMREELEAFRDANAQEYPVAERLEEMARVEISRCIDEVKIRGAKLEGAKDDYSQVRGEMKEIGELARKNQKVAAQMRSMVNVASTTVKECQKALEKAMESVISAEVLLNRAVRIRLMQDDLLPLFQLLTEHEDPHHNEVKFNHFCAALTILMNATFDQKMNFFLGLFDAKGHGLFSAKYLVQVISIFQKSLRLLHFLPYSAPMEDLVYNVERSFRDFNLNPDTDMLNQYEVRAFLITLISRNVEIAGIFGLQDAGAAMSSFQRNRLSPITLLMLGMVGPTAAKYRTHYDMNKYRPSLNPENRRAVHERSLAMGADDPLKPDYSLFIQKSQSKKSSRVDPLFHGHLMNVNYVEKYTRHEAAVLIQSLWRCIRDMKVAERAAKKAAFMESLNLALKEMKEKIVKEFRRREENTGVAKQRWDSQVRLSQAKMLASGQSVSRADMVLIMMEETMKKARAEIEARFKKLEQSENIDAANFFGRDLPEDFLYTAEYFIDKLFAEVWSKNFVHKDYLDDSTGLEEEDGPSKEASNETKGDAEMDEDGDTEREDSDEAKELELTIDIKEKHKNMALVTVSNETTLSIVRGDYKHSALDLGENSIVREMRLVVAMPEPEHEKLMYRLRSLHNCITALKSMNILAEFPSKRLLLSYVNTTNEMDLSDDLREHFLFPKTTPTLFIAQAMKNFFASDFECGLASKFVYDLKQDMEKGFIRSACVEIKAMLGEMNELVERKLQTNINAVRDIVIQQEIEKYDSNIRRCKQAADECTENLEKLKMRLHKSRLAAIESTKRKQCALMMKDSRDVDDDAVIGVEERLQWVRRLKWSLGRAKMVKTVISSDDEAYEAMVAYAETRACVREFLDTVRQDAIIIISELNHPKHAKTMRIVAEGTVHGRPSYSGRGYDGGKYYTYEAHNITYKICEDYSGIYNGSDEYAAKVGGLDRLGSMEYFKAHIPRLNVPLMATVDYGGFRILATAKLPSEKIIFGDDGDVRKVVEDMVHGIKGDGNNFINNNKTVQKMLQVVGSKMNLVPHQCKGFKDISPSITYGSAEMKIYKGKNDDYFVRDFYRCFPSEIPSETPHLTFASREQSVFWRQLRPEFCKQYGQALSPDATSTITSGTGDRERHYGDLEYATRNLISKVIPDYLELLIKRDFVLPLSEGLGLDVASELHARGINIRHLGLLRSMLWKVLPGTVNIYYREAQMHTGRDLREEISNGDKIEVNGVEFTVTETDRNKITRNTVPLDTKYMGESLNRVFAMGGALSSKKNSEDLRSVFLAEMVARAMKNIIRQHLRVYARKEKIVSFSFTSALVCEYFNVVTGASPKANKVLQEEVYVGIINRYGTVGCRPSEQNNLQEKIEPCIIFIIRRLMTMLGIRMNVTCLGEFHERPAGFMFQAMDVMETTPVVHHNIPVLALAEAQLISIRAREAEKEIYVEQILQDSPSLLFRLSERKGSRAAENYRGTIANTKTSARPGDSHSSRKGRGGGHKINPHGSYYGAVELERPGPISYDPFVWAANFRIGHKGHVDAKFNPQTVPLGDEEQFSVECFCKVMGGEGRFRTVLENGRYAITVGKDNVVNFSLNQGIATLTCKIGRVELDQWIHIACTFDGTAVRCYADSVLCTLLEIEAPLRAQIDLIMADFHARHEELRKEEEKERKVIYNKSADIGEKFLQSKDGYMIMKKYTEAIMESDDFTWGEDEGQGKNALERMQRAQAKKNEAARLAKKRYIDELYDTNARSVAERYKKLHDDLIDEENKKPEEAALRLRRGLRVGAGLGSGINDSKHQFDGDVSCVSVYNRCLSADRVRAHYLSSVGNKMKQMQRLYAEASIKFEAALQFAPNDNFVLQGYAQSLCRYLKVEQFQSSAAAFTSRVGTNSIGVSKGKLKVQEAIKRFHVLGLPEGIAEIVKYLPRDTEFADLVCQGFVAMYNIDRLFFSRGTSSVTRADLVKLPLLYNLDYPSNPKEFIATAARIYQEVAKDIDLRSSYGEIDLGWIGDLKCPELIISLVRYAAEETNLKVIKMGEMFKKAGWEIISATDEDVETVVYNLTLSLGMDLSACSLITNDSLNYVRKMRNLKILNLDGCFHITDFGMKYLEELAPQLEVLSLAGLTMLTDDGVKDFCTRCTMLNTINLNKCSQVSYDTIQAIATSNKYLASISVAHTYLTDSGLSALAHRLSRDRLTHFDISYCRDITDFGLIALAESCPQLKSINLAGLSRITDEGVKHITSKCWYLEYINLEDLFLLDDEVFWYNPTYDGRPAADATMLTKLKEVNLKECVNLTDQALCGLSERCRHVEKLHLKGCEKLKDGALEFMAQPFSHADPSTFAGSLFYLDLSFCSGITGNGISTLLPACWVLEDLNLSGIPTVTDQFIHDMCLNCPTIQRLVLQKCVLLTDAAMCSLADYLWIEELDISSCSKITDEGMDVVTTACQGLKTFTGRRAFKLTGRTIQSLSRNCKIISHIDVRDCPQVTKSSVEDLIYKHPLTKVLL